MTVSRQQMEIIAGINTAISLCHGAARSGGWWTSLITGLPLQRNKGEMLMLMVSEVAEAMEGVRKNKPDEHVPLRSSEEVELADALIRIFDYAGGFGLDLAGAMIDKMAYNATREDHKLENRAKVGGKQF